MGASTAEMLIRIKNVPCDGRPSRENSEWMEDQMSALALDQGTDFSFSPTAWPTAPYSDECSVANHSQLKKPLSKRCTNIQMDWG